MSAASASDPTKDSSILVRNTYKNATLHLNDFSYIQHTRICCGLQLQCNAMQDTSVALHCTALHCSAAIESACSPNDVQTKAKGFYRLSHSTVLHENSHTNQRLDKHDRLRIITSHSGADDEEWHHGKVKRAETQQEAEAKANYADSSALVPPIKVSSSELSKTHEKINTLASTLKRADKLTQCILQHVEE